MDLYQMISSLRLLMLLFIGLWLLPTVSFAQEALPATTDEDVAIAFFKTANTNPNFEKWAKGTKDYKIVAPTRADDYVAKEKQRLMVKWREFDTNADILNVRSTITVHLNRHANEAGEEEFYMDMAFEKEDAPYFPFVFQDYKFALIPQKIETFLRQPLSKAQFNLIYTDFKENMSGRASLHLQMKAAKAYIQQPYEIDGIEQWVLLADPVTLSLKSYRSGADLWTYGANWYVSPAKKEVQDLYKAPDKAVPVPQSP